MKVNEVSTPFDLTNPDSACLAVRQATIDVFINSLNMNDMNW